MCVVYLFEKARDVIINVNVSVIVIVCVDIELIVTTNVT